MNTNTITIFGKQRKVVSFDRATTIAMNLKDNKEFQKKVTKNHILYGFGPVFFEPVYVTDEELKLISIAYRELGTIYCLHK